MSRYDAFIRLFVTIIVTLFLAVPAVAFAQDESTTDSERVSLDPVSLDTDDADSEDGNEGVWLSDIIEDENYNDNDVDVQEGESPVKGHGFQLGMTFVGVPDYIFGAWFSEHGSVWKDGVVNMGFSLDYFLRFEAPCEMRFSLSWVNARTSSDYWLDKNYKQYPHLADYVVNNLSIVSLEVAAYHVIPIIDEIAFYYGGGLWGGVILGDAKSYAIRSSCASSADDLSQCPHEPGSVPLSQMPPAFGFVEITLGFKFTLWEVMTIRAEGGFKGYFYGQVGLGVEF